MCWVVITTDRGRRPRDFILDREKVATYACPFCYGQEAKTPPEVFAVRAPGTAPDGPGWKVRVIPNKYPALRIEGELDKRGEGLYDAMNGIGAHEVVIETPDHDRDMAEFTPTEIVDVLKAYRARLLDLRRDVRFRYIILFKNHGAEAGAPIPHAHSQIIAVPVVPPMVTTEFSVCRDYFDRKERCLMCDILLQELSGKSRIVRDDGNTVVYAPYASRYPFELRIVPRKHGHDFALLGDQELERLAEALKDTFMRMRKVLRDPPYNIVLHNSPPMHLRLGKLGQWSSIPYDFHWHFELIPRLARTGGCEWGSGFYMNTVPPEDAARFLREADLSIY